MNEWILPLAALVFAAMGAEGFWIFQLRRKIQESSRLLDNYRAAVPSEAVRQELETFRRKAQEYFAKIEEVIEERETWRKLYHHQAIGHDNAQNLMLRQINELARAYKNATGKEFRIDPLIEHVRGSWDSQHGVDARGQRDTKE